MKWLSKILFLIVGALLALGGAHMWWRQYSAQQATLALQQQEAATVKHNKLCEALFRTIPHLTLYPTSSGEVETSLMFSGSNIFPLITGWISTGIVDKVTNAWITTGTSDYSFKIPRILSGTKGEYNTLFFNAQDGSLRLIKKTIYAKDSQVAFIINYLADSGAIAQIEQSITAEHTGDNCVIPSFEDPNSGNRKGRYELTYYYTPSQDGTDGSYNANRNQYMILRGDTGALVVHIDLTTDLPFDLLQRIVDSITINH